MHHALNWKHAKLAFLVQYLQINTYIQYFVIRYFFMSADTMCIQYASANISLTSVYIGVKNNSIIVTLVRHVTSRQSTKLLGPVKCFR